MCGICGYSGRQEDRLMRQMLDCLRHRGPDDSGCYFGSGIQLGIARLSVIDIEGGHQPIASEDSAIWAVFNGEIYNYIELREELKKKGHIFKTLSDTETIVHAYEEYGYYFSNKLNGMFSIALWDDRNKILLLIRDRFGVKPLFYMLKPDKLVFASEIKAILCHPDASREIDYGALSHFFSLRNIPAPFTIYKEIRALLPGHMLIWDRTGGRVLKWYELQMNNECQQNGEDDLACRLDELLRDSVRLRLRSDVNYGAFLSGGIDSSTIVAMMSEFSPQPIKTFSLNYSDSPLHKRDAYYARKISQRYSTEHYEYTMGWADLGKDMSRVICHLDQPFSGVISSFWLSRFMKQYVTVALSGDGADDIFASYGHHRLVWPLFAVRKALKNNNSVNEIDFSFFQDKRDVVLELARYSPWEWRLAYASFMEHEKNDLFSEKVRKDLMPYSTSDFLKRIYLNCAAGTDDLNNMLYLDINTLLPNEILYYNDMLSMANSLEVRTPFLDYRIVELACSIPGRLKIKNLTLKYILRKVAARYLPDEILERPKEGFVLPKNTWLREGMSATLKNILSKERLAIHNFFNQGYVDSLTAKFLSGDETLTFKIWTLIVFQVWYENYLGMGS